MRPFLNDFIDSLSKRQQSRVAYLLEEAKLGKEDLPQIAERLSELDDFVPLFVNTVRQYDLIKSQGFFTNLRDSESRVAEIYEVSNLVSLLIDSHQQVLLSEAKALEDELIALDKEAQNYSFLLSDNGAFDFAYLETFSDNLGRDDLVTSISDRASLAFGPLEVASVNAAEGVLILPQNLSTSYSLNASIVEGNVTSMLNNMNVGATTIAGTQGWRASVDASAPITSGTPLAEGQVGAQVVIEYRLPESSPASEIKISPFADAVQTLVQVHIYPGDDETGREQLMSSPVELDRQYTLHFPMRSVKRFKIVLNQPIYNRVSQFANTEDEYREAYERVQRKLKEINDTYNVSQEPTFNRLYQMVMNFLRKGKPFPRGSNVFRTDQPLTLHTSLSGPMHPNSLSALLGGRWNSRSLWRGVTRSPVSSPNQFELETVMLRLFHEQSDIFNMLTRREVEEFNSWLSTKGLYDPEGVITTPLKRIYNEAFVYRYNFGIANVSIGVESVGYKGFWVSTPFDSDGDFGEVRIKTAEDNYRATNTDLGNNVLTSVEYSVTNRSNPSAEDDWIPILPIGQSFVESERVYPDSTGRCRFRFGADGTADIVVYKNGYPLEVNPNSDWMYDKNRQGIVGVRLPVRSYTTEDIITVRYTTVRDYTTISFEAEGFTEAPLVTAYDELGAGEGFSTTIGRNEVQLSHVPFIDENSLRTSNYNSSFGLTPYQPITVRLSDGTVPINLTNYKTGAQASLPLDGYYYIHSGKTLIFNKPIDSNFRVYYQYLKNNVRVRVVMRCNSRDYVSPKVDFYHLKAKTRRPIKEILS